MQNRFYKGQSLIELMVAMTVGLFLLSIVITLFQSAKLTAIHVDKLIQIQESARTIFYGLKQDLGQANSQVLNPDNIPKALSERFAAGTSPLFLESKQQKILYFISAKNKIFELHRKNLSESSYNQDAIAEGIKNFQIEYGVIQNKNLQFVMAADVHNWQEIKLVKISLQIVADHLTQKKLNFIIGIN